MADPHTGMAADRTGGPAYRYGRYRHGRASVQAWPGPRTGMAEPRTGMAGPTYRHGRARVQAWAGHVQAWPGPCYTLDWHARVSVRPTEKLKVAHASGPQSSRSIAGRHKGGV